MYKIHFCHGQCHFLELLQKEDCIILVSYCKVVLFFLEEGLYHIFHREATQERWQMIFGPSAERINRLLGGKTQLLCQHIPVGSFCL